MLLRFLETAKEAIGKINNPVETKNINTLNNTVRKLDKEVAIKYLNTLGFYSEGVNYKNKLFNSIKYSQEEQLVRAYGKIWSEIFMEIKKTVEAIKVIGDKVEKTPAYLKLIKISNKQNYHIDDLINEALDVDSELLSKNERHELYVLNQEAKEFYECLHEYCKATNGLISQVINNLNDLSEVNMADKKEFLWAIENSEVTEGVLFKVLNENLKEWIKPKEEKQNKIKLKM